MFGQPLETCIIEYPFRREPGPLQFALVDQSELARLEVLADGGGHLALNGKLAMIRPSCRLWLYPGHYEVNIRKYNFFFYYPNSGRSSQQRYLGTAYSDPSTVTLEAGDRKSVRMESPVDDQAQTRTAEAIARAYRTADASHQPVWNSRRGLAAQTRKITVARGRDQSVAIWSAGTGSRRHRFGIETWVALLDEPEVVRPLIIPGTRAIFRPELMAPPDGPWTLFFWDCDAEGGYVGRTAHSLDGLSWQAGAPLPATMDKRDCRMDWRCPDLRFSAFSGDKVGGWLPDGRVWVCEEDTLHLQAQLELPPPLEGHADAVLCALTWHQGRWLGIVSHRKPHGNKKTFEAQIVEVRYWEPTGGTSSERVAWCRLDHARPNGFMTGSLSQEEYFAPPQLEILSTEGPGVRLADAFQTVLLPWDASGEQLEMTPVAPGWKRTDSAGVFSHAFRKSMEISPRGVSDLCPWPDGRVERVLFHRNSVVRGITGPPKLNP